MLKISSFQGRAVFLCFYPVPHFVFTLTPGLFLTVLAFMSFAKTPRILLSTVHNPIGCGSYCCPVGVPKNLIRSMRFFLICLVNRITEFLNTFNCKETVVQFTVNVLKQIMLSLILSFQKMHLLT